MPAARQLEAHGPAFQTTAAAETFAPKRASNTDSHGNWYVNWGQVTRGAVQCCSPSSLMHVVVMLQ